MNSLTMSSAELSKILDILCGLAYLQSTLVVHGDLHPVSGISV